MKKIITIGTAALIGMLCFSVEAGGTSWASSTDPSTGITTKSVQNADGSRTVTQTASDGTLISSRTVPPRGKRTPSASSTDKKTGIKITAKGNRKGSRTVIVTDRFGHFISRRVVPMKPVTFITSTCTKTGKKKKVTCNKNGSRTIRHYNPYGTVIFIRNVPRWKKKRSCRSAKKPACNKKAISAEKPVCRKSVRK